MNILINITGAVLIIISSVLLSYILCQKEKAALNALKNTANAYSEISSDIRTGYTSLPDAFLNVYDKAYDKTTKDYFKLLYTYVTSEEYSDINTIVEECVERIFNRVLNTKDRCLLKELGTLPIHLDVVMQVNYIDEVVTRIRQRISEYSASIAVKCRMYNAVCICAGIMIIIILL